MSFKCLFSIYFWVIENHENKDSSTVFNLLIIFTPDYVFATGLAYIVRRRFDVTLLEQAFTAFSCSSVDDKNGISLC